MNCLINSGIVHPTGALIIPFLAATSSAGFTGQNIPQRTLYYTCLSVRRVAFHSFCAQELLFGPLIAAKSRWHRAWLIPWTARIAAAMVVSYPSHMTLREISLLKKAEPSGIFFGPITLSFITSY